MSKADVRAGTILAMVVGSARLLQDRHNTMFIRKAVNGLHDEAEKALEIIIPRGDQRQITQISDNLIAFAKKSNESAVSNTSTLGYLATMLLDDLMLLINNPEKLEILENCYRWADQVIAVADPDDCAVDCRVVADRTVADLYGVVGVG